MFHASDRACTNRRVKSMTGYGTASQTLGSGEVVVEIRAVNHRFLDVRTVASPDLVPYAHEAEQALRKAALRGRYEMRLRTTGSTPTVLEVDAAAVRVSYAALCALNDELGAEGKVSIADAIAVLSEPLRAPEANPEVMDVVLRAVGAALDDLDRMRVAEGKALAAELTRSLELLRRSRDHIAAGCADAVAQQRERLRQRVAQLLSDADVVADESRLEMELAVLADRSDVTEELVRIESHVDQLAALMQNDGGAGRKLDFLLQELNREANTLAAKLPDAALTHVAVEIKSEIERMRQQAANVL